MKWRTQLESFIQKFNHECLLSLVKKIYVYSKFYIRRYKRKVLRLYFLRRYLNSIKYSNWIELYRGMIEREKNINWYLMLHILVPLLHACVLACRMQIICFTIEYLFKEIFILRVGKYNTTFFPILYYNIFVSFP